MSDSPETRRFETQNIPTELVEDAGPWEYGERKEAIVKMLKQRAYGDGIVETEAVIEASREQLEGEISAFKRIEREFSNTPSFASLVERIKEERIERTHEVARANRDRLTKNEEQIADREDDPEVASQGAVKSAVEAVEALLQDGTVPDMYLIEGPENYAVKQQAEKCGMEPGEFFEFVIAELDESQLQVERPFETRYDQKKSAVATDGSDVS